VVVKKTFRYSNVFSYKHLYQPECFYEKRYKAVVKKTICFLSVFFYNHLYQPECFYEKRYKPKSYPLCKLFFKQN